MSKNNIFHRIIEFLVGGKPASEQEAAPQHNGSMMGKLLQMVENTDDVEIGCDEVFELLDQYVELEARGENVADLLPFVKKHLDRCRDCHEEYDALARILEATSQQN